MPTPKQLKTINLYLSLMEEAKARMDAINLTLGGRTGLLEVFADEFCTLQLRMLCELIALGCLVTHGDIQETLTQKMQEEYAAHLIVARLERLHPEFYPHPVRQIVHRSGEAGLEDIESGFLTKAELVELAGRCGGALHRGTARKILTHRALQPDEIARWALKIQTLLDIHWFKLLGGDPLYLCSMRHGADGGVGVSFVPSRGEDRR